MNIDVEELMSPARDALKGLKLVNWQLRDIDGVVLDTRNNPEDQKLIDSILNGSGGLIEYGGDLYVIYIPDRKQSKFHVTECATIKRMHTQNKYHRYVLTRDTSGFFEITMESGKKRSEQLDVCHNCLDTLENIKDGKYVQLDQACGYGLSDRRKYTFDIARFFEIYGGVNFKSAPAKTS